MSPTIRGSLRRVAGDLATLIPQARYDRTILVLSHMRAATTALSNVLCSHAAISGYGETHVPHDRPGSPGRVLVNQALRRAWDPRAQHLLDKVLHDRLDGIAPPAFYRARAIFLVRAPRASVRSIRALAQRTGMAEVASAEAAARYYADRLDTLAAHWTHFAPDRRLGLASETLLSDPDGVIARIGAWLALSPPLENHYVGHRATQIGGGGDPTRSAALTRIEARPGAAETGPVEDVPAALSERCAVAHARLLGLFETPG